MRGILTPAFHIVTHSGTHQRLLRLAAEPLNSKEQKKQEGSVHLAMTRCPKFSETHEVNRISLLAIH